MTHPLLLGWLLIGKPHMVVLCGYTPKPWFYVLVRCYTNRSSHTSTSYQEKKPRGGYVSHTVVIHLISWLYVVIYCNCTEKESEPHSDNQGRPPFIMTSATSRKYPRRWFYVVIRPKPWLYILVRGYTTLSSPDASVSYQEKPRGDYVSLTLVICLISWLCVVICGYTPQAMVIRLVLINMRQQLTRKTRGGWLVSLTVVIQLVSWLCVVIYCICTENV